MAENKKLWRLEVDTDDYIHSLRESRDRWRRMARRQLGIIIGLSAVIIVMILRNP
jgi:hypothetical protein